MKSWDALSTGIGFNGESYVRPPLLHSQISTPTQEMVQLWPTICFISESQKLSRTMQNAWATRLACTPYPLLLWKPQPSLILWKTIRLCLGKASSATVAWSQYLERQRMSLFSSTKAFVSYWTFHVCRDLKKRTDKLLDYKYLRPRVLSIL